MTRSFLRLVLPAAIAIAGCSANDVRLDSNSGGDAARDQAMALFIDRTVTDRLDAEGGDHTDWKYVDILDPGGLRVEVSVDTPEQLGKSYAELTDAFGNRLDRQLITTGQTNYVFTREVETTPDKYYVRVFTEKGGSVYTVGVRMSYPPPPPPPPAPKVEPREPDPPPRTRTRIRRRPSKPPPPTVKPPPVAEPDPPPVAAPKVITGNVVRIIPAKDDQSVALTVVVPGGSDITKTSHRVVAYKGGAEVDDSASVISASGRQVVVRLNAPPGKANGTTKVKFTPR